MDDTRKEMEEKYGRDAYVNMDRLATFMVRMIKKYGPEVLKELEEKEKKETENTKEDGKK